MAPAVFADDAKVLPAMFGRITIAPNYSFIPGSFDSGGELVKWDKQWKETGITNSFAKNPLKIFNLGFAFEFGIINFITAVLQWTPGWTPWSNISPAVNYEKANTNGLADIFFGAKIQILGDNARFQNEKIRLAVAPGILIPFSGADFNHELKNKHTNYDATLSQMDKHVFGLGGRFYFDYVISKNFFINLYNESLFYIGKGDLSKADATFAGVKASNSAFRNVKSEINYKYSLTFEIEPVFTYPLGGALSLFAGIPINYKYSPASEYSISGLTKSYRAEFMDALADNRFNMKPEASHILSINPNISLYLTKFRMPLEFKLQYNIPVWGMNAQAKHTVMFQFKLYFGL